MEEPGGLQSMGSQRVGHDFTCWQNKKEIKTWKNQIRNSDRY